MTLSNKPPTETTIRVSSRPGWHQRTTLGFNSFELDDRMQAMARWELQRNDWLFEAVVVAEHPGGAKRYVRLERPRAAA